MNNERVVELTAMQELISRFEKREPKNFAEQLFFNAVIAEATELLAKEKNDQMEAYDAGQLDMVLDLRGDTRKHQNAEDYYSLTYKQINVREL